METKYVFHRFRDWPILFIHFWNDGLLTLSVTYKFMIELDFNAEQLWSLICGLLSWFILLVFISRQELPGPKLIVMLSTVSPGRLFCFLYMFPVCFNRFYVSRCAWLFIPEVCCHRFDTSVIVDLLWAIIGASFLRVFLAALWIYLVCLLIPSINKYETRYR